MDRNKKLSEIIPKNGIVFNEKNEFSEILCKPKLLPLKSRAGKLKTKLEEIDRNLFKRLRENIRAERYTGEEFKNLVNEYVDFDLEDIEHQEESGYDNLDLFINGLFPPLTIPEQTKELEPEMVFYQKTPARIISVCPARSISGSMSVT